MKKEIKLNETYNLDLGGPTPVNVTTLEINENGVMCKYNNSYLGRVELLTYDLFEINGLYKPLNRIEKIEKRLGDNVLLFDKHELESLKKISKTTKISEYEVLTDEGFVDIEALHETIPYEVYHLKLSDGKELKSADNHIVFKFNETNPNDFIAVFVKDLKLGDKIITQYNDKGEALNSMVIEVTNLGHEEVMYDLELKEGSNRRYYTNGILSHNTHIAKKLAEYMFGDEDSLIRLDMSEFQEKHSISRLIGSPPGYVGHEEGGQLTEKVRRRPYSIVLFDEIEKANKEIYNTLLQLLDDGQLTDSSGRKVNFKNCMVIMTSNVGVKKLSDFGTGVGFGTKSKIEREESIKDSMLLDELKKQFPPEFLNRLDDVVIFKTLTKEQISKIVELEIDKLVDRVTEIGFTLQINKTAKDYLVEQGYDKEYGARPLNRAIQKYIEDPVSEEILSGRVKKGQTIKVSYIKSKDEIVVKSE
jgi:hypothetical protein